MFLAKRDPGKTSRKVHRPAAAAALAALLLSGAGRICLDGQQTAPTATGELAEVPLPQPRVNALPLPEDRGQAALEQTLKRLGTTASVLAIVAHPDDEDGALLTYLSRGLGVRATLFTLTRGEGGQNAMSADDEDALGLMRTNELLMADRYYGAKQLWGTEVDFGFSKTQQEAFSQWGHQRVLYDAVLAVRRVRPQVILATFVGGVTDGHGQHQVSGEIAQEAFKDAGDPKVFPDQLKDGLQPWQPLAVYSRAPFARVTSQGMFDYATGKWAPARFRNYVTGQWIEGKLPIDVTIPVGKWDPVLGRSYMQIARQGWGMQKSQYGGANPTLSGPGYSSYHLWAVDPAARAAAGTTTENDDLFHNSKVQIDTSLEGLTHLVKGRAPAWLADGLRQIDQSLKQFQATCVTKNETESAHALAPIYRHTLDLYAKVKASNLDPEAKAGLELELSAKLAEFQSALKDMLGLDLAAFTTQIGNERGRSPFPGESAEETPRSVVPAEEFAVRIHTSTASPEAHLTRTWFQSETGASWTNGTRISNNESAGTADTVYRLRVPENAQPTKPYFTRPSIEQPYYDLTQPEDRGRSFPPYPLSAWAEFTFDGVPIRMGEVVQTLRRVLGPGGIYEPLVVTPAIGVSITPQARILPLDGSALPVQVTVHAQEAAQGTVRLQLPAGWRSDPLQQQFNLASVGDTEPLTFLVRPAATAQGVYNLMAVAKSGGKTYSSGWRSVGYAGLLPYNLYRPAELKTRKVDVKIAPGLRVGYVMGTGDTVPEAIRELGVTPDLLTPAELTSGNLSAWSVIVVGIRAYSSLPELAAAQPRLDEFVRRGGTLIVQYQSATFPAPLPLAMGRFPERVVDERDPVKLLAPDNPLLAWPNKITPADFNDWIEERGHSFMDSWAPGYTPLTETADPGQDPQRGGLLVAHPGKGTYIYVAYALYRQLPELIPGAYRLLANLLSAGKYPAH